MFLLDWLVPQNLGRLSEKRKHHRFYVADIPHLGLGVEESHQPVQINDISRGGVSVQWNDPAPEGCQRLLHLFLNGLDLGVIAGVVSRDGGRTGYRFIDTDHPGLVAFIELLESGLSLHQKPPDKKHLEGRESWLFKGHGGQALEMIFLPEAENLMWSGLRIKMDRVLYQLTIEPGRLHIFQGSEPNQGTALNDRGAKVLVILGALAFLLGARHPVLMGFDLQLIDILNQQLQELRYDTPPEA